MRLHQCTSATVLALDKPTGQVALMNMKKLNYLFESRWVFLTVSET